MASFLDSIKAQTEEKKAADQAAKEAAEAQAKAAADVLRAEVEAIDPQDAAQIEQNKNEVLESLAALFKKLDSPAGRIVVDKYRLNANEFRNKYDQFYVSGSGSYDYGADLSAEVKSLGDDLGQNYNVYPGLVDNDPRRSAKDRTNDFAFERFGYRISNKV